MVMFLCFGYFGVYMIIPSIFNLIGNIVFTIINSYNFREAVPDILSSLLGSITGICAIALLGLCFLKIIGNQDVPSFGETSQNTLTVSADLDDKVSRIESLQKLYETGTISQEEFETKKKTAFRLISKYALFLFLLNSGRNSFL